MKVRHGCVMPPSKRRWSSDGRQQEREPHCPTARFWPLLGSGTATSLEQMRTSLVIPMTGPSTKISWVTGSSTCGWRTVPSRVFAPYRGY
jgi:hypothetical protein